MRNKTIRIILTTFTAFLLFLLPLGGTLIHAQDKGDDAALFERIWTNMNQVEDPDKYFSELPREIQEFMISELSHVEVRVKSIENFEE